MSWAGKRTDSDNNTGGIPYYVGQYVLLAGTGTRWGGGCFRATIEDIRADDDTVKVKYDDGGYKRFPRSEFVGILAGDADDDNSLAFGTRDFEWSDDVYNPVVQSKSELNSLHEQMNAAVRSRDFLLADELKQKVAVAQKAVYELHVAEGKLLAAVQRQDFLAANEIQKSIDAMHQREEKKNKLQRRATAIAAGKSAAEVLEAEKAPSNTKSVKEILKEASDRAMRGGLAGAGAMVVQVGSLMWMRTTMNYQYRYGSNFTTALKTLYKDGGIPRFYRGVGPALLQGPLSRFGDTAANVGMLAALDASENTRSLPVGVKTLAASASAAAFRIALMPVDTIKTMMQVEGKEGISKLKVKMRASGPSVFFHGALGASAATFAGHYPWFATYNTLDAAIPVPQEKLQKLGRNALLGFCSSVVSDTVSNSIRVLKTYRQTSEVKISYVECARNIVEEHGIGELFGRGLKTRLLANATQGIMFSVMWKYLDEVFRAPAAGGDSKAQ